MAGSVSFDSRRGLINHRCACVAHDFVLGIRASRTIDCADDIALLDQWNTASKRNDSTECEQIVKLHKLNTILEDLLAVGRRKVTAARALCSAVWMERRNRLPLGSFSNSAFWPLRRQREWPPGLALAISDAHKALSEDNVKPPARSSRHHPFLLWLEPWPLH